MKQPPRTIQSLDRAVAVLDLLAARAEGLRLTVLADQLALKPQTAQSLLRTLERHGLVGQAGRGEPYILGPRVHQWSRRWDAASGWAATARPIVVELGDTLGEYVLLTRLQGDTLSHLVERTADRSLTVSRRAEDSAHLHTMATAKVLLAFAPEAERRRIVNGLPMRKRGPRSVTDRDEFLAVLADIRRRGYAECVDETAEGVVAVAVPVDTLDRPGALALGTALPHVRYTDPDAILAHLRRAAARISAACGADHA